jgi:hypothetical protein
MADKVIDSLFFELGIDTSQLQTVLENIDEFIAGITDSVREFAEGFQEGFQEAFQDAARGVENAAKTATDALDEMSEADTDALNEMIRDVADALGEMSEAGVTVTDALNEMGDAGVADVADAARDAGTALKDMGDKGEAGGKAVEKSAEKATKKVNKLGKAAHKVGHFFGQQLKRIVTSTFAPIMAVVAGGAILGAYSKDLARLDELQKKTALSTEELAEKQELLATYSKEDQATFARLKKQTDGLTKQLKLAAASVMRVLVPALEWLATKAQMAFRIIKENKVFVLSVIAAIALAMTASLLPALKALWISLTTKIIPAVMRFTAALLANPLFWIAAAIIGVGLVLDDLWTYMNGGESAFEGLWEMLGTSEELMATFNAAVKWLGEVWDSVMAGLRAAADTFFDYFGPAVDALLTVFGNAWKAIKALLTGNFAAAFESWKDYIKSLADFLV